MKPLFAKVEPVLVASFLQRSLSLRSELFCFETQILKYEALVDKAIEGQTDPLCSQLVLHRLYLGLLHLVEGQGLQRSKQ